MPRIYVNRSPAVVFLLLLSACGGGGSNSSPPPPSPPQGGSAPGAPALQVAADIKQLVFTWTSVPSATSYRLFQNPDGASGFTQVGGDRPATQTRATLDIAVHRHDWVHALYRLEACNANGCSASNAMSAVDAMVRAIGYFKASNTQDDADFGTAVALSADGSTLAVSASGENSGATGVNGDQNDRSAQVSGAVYVFTRNGTQQWVQQAYIKASNTQEDDAFGNALALSEHGDTLAVSAPGEDSDATGAGGDQGSNDAQFSGAVFVFTRAGTQWTQQAYLKASNTEENDVFGSSLAMSADGNTLAVGAAFEDSSSTGVDGNQADNSSPGAGAVYVFVRSGSDWSQQAYLKAANTDLNPQFSNDVFGSSLAMSADGNILAVGAPSESSRATGVDGDQADNGADGAGAVYVFARAGIDWSQQAYVKASNTGPSDSFGASLALSADGTTLAVGADSENSNATAVNNDQNNEDAFDSGAVYVFVHGASGWTQQAYVKASNTQEDADFGTSVALSADGNTLAVGAPGENSAAIGVNGDQADRNAPASGAAYVFTRGTNGWSQLCYVKASNTHRDADTAFGFALALSADGNTLAVAAPFELSAATGIGGDQTDSTAPSAGAVYVF